MTKISKNMVENQQCLLDWQVQHKANKNPRMATKFILKNFRKSSLTKSRQILKKGGLYIININFTCPMKANKYL